MRKTSPHADMPGTGHTERAHFGHGRNDRVLNTPWHAVDASLPHGQEHVVAVRHVADQPRFAHMARQQRRRHPAADRGTTADLVPRVIPPDRHIPTCVDRNDLARPARQLIHAPPPLLPRGIIPRHLQGGPGKRRPPSGGFRRRRLKRARPGEWAIRLRHSSLDSMNVVHIDRPANMGLPVSRE